MSEIVVDASVVLKWYLRDEEFGERAREILRRYVKGTLELVAPTLLPYEVGNALLIAEKRSRIDRSVTKTAFDAFLELEIPLEDPLSDPSEVFVFSRTYMRSIYDASYLALAGKRNVRLVTGDKRLFNAVKGKLPWIDWIGHVSESTL